MKVKVHNFKKGRTQGQVETLDNFLRFLQDEAPLYKDVYVNFTDDRNGVKMTTGVRYPGHRIYVLAGKRMLIDVLRTLAHEWVHEFQHQKLGMSEKKKIQNIGGPEENMCNILAGIFVKKFEKQNPELQKFLYDEDEISS